MSKLIEIISSIDESLKQIAKAQDVLASKVNPYYKLTPEETLELLKVHGKSFEKMMNEMNAVFGEKK